MIKDFLIVSIGSFFGGGLRFLVSVALRAVCTSPFPLGTFAVNVLGCLVIGLVSGLCAPDVGSGRLLSSGTGLLLTTGFCGGFTTFSTFMKENAALMREDHAVWMAAYIGGSLVCGFLAVLAGHQLAKAL